MSKFVIENEKLISEWDWEKNKVLNLFPDQLLEGSNKKVYWKCKKGHKWEASIVNRTKGRGCPYCANKKILKGYNDLGTTHPELLSEWNYEKNLEISIDKVLSGSSKKVWWKCDKGHEWEAVISSRVQGVGCPFCSNKRVLKNYNDLASLYPKIAEDWDYEKNGTLRPDNVVYGSNKRVWWKCKKCDHSWATAIYLRTIKGTKCPKCEDLLKKIRPFQREVPEEGESFADLYPELLKEWNYDLNGKILPTQLKRASGRKVWWRCEKGHEWKCSINNRTLHNTGCPICNQAYHISFPEKAIAYYLSSVIDEIIENYRPDFLNKKELDIYLPLQKLAIEYDGEYAHQRMNRDIDKDKLCEENGIHVIHIRQKGCPLIESTKMEYYQLLDNSMRELGKGIEFIFCYLGFDFKKIDVEKDQSSIYEYMDIQKKKNSLQDKAPQLSQEWNFEKNGYLKPIHVSSQSNKKVWWKCNKGHEWEASIFERNKGTGCPLCYNNRK